ncbi:MAG: hypothetical protein K1X44_06505 [Alphaproteobacteria bacterium]|nr:hypothetical protein [Alphaproteobacteria bacterium]
MEKKTESELLIELFGFDVSSYAPQFWLAFKALIPLVERYWNDPNVSVNVNRYASMEIQKIQEQNLLRTKVIEAINKEYEKHGMVQDFVSKSVA